MKIADVFEEEDEIIKLHKINTCAWSLDTTNALFYKRLKDNAIKVLSIDGHASVTLLPNRFVIIVE